MEYHNAKFTTRKYKFKIFEIRGQKVMLDSDLAEFYNVESKYLNRQVKRNFKRFYEVDFMFPLTENELENCGAKLAPQKLQSDKIGFIKS